jgi:O-acetyl-ADP-ribose deacetylase
MTAQVVDGDLLDQPVEVIVNAWNRNVIPWWLLLPQGVSGAIKKRGGLQPFKELARFGPIPLGQSVQTSAGKLPFKAIVHVAGINLIWRSSEKAIRDSVRNAMALVTCGGFDSVAFPVIGSGSGGFSAQKALELMLDELDKLTGSERVIIVRYVRPA